MNVSKALFYNSLSGHATNIIQDATDVIPCCYRGKPILTCDNIVDTSNSGDMKSHLTIWITLLVFLIGPALHAQDNLKIKDANGNVLLEARPEGITVRKMSTADRMLIAGLDTENNGLLVYDTDTKSLWMWRDTEWIELDGIDLVDDADHDPTNELQDWLTLPGIPACFSDGIDNVDDADNDPTNELQSWTTLPGIPAGFSDGVDNVDDADNDPTNELQSWTTLPGIPAGFSDGVDNVDDADNDPTNELQSWTTLPGIPAGFSDGVDNVDDADNDPTNELQSWTTLPGIPAGFSDGVDNVDDADNDPTNETNTSLLLNGNVLELTDNGGTLSADLSGLTNDNDWTVDAGKVYNTNDNVGIGTADPQAGLHVKGSKGIGEHVMLIENTDPAGSGLNIKIDGSHPLFVSQQGGDGFFVTHPVSGLDSLFDPIVDNIRSYLLSGAEFSPSDINFSQIASPGGLLDQLGMVDLVSGGVCKGVSTLVDLVNAVGLQSISLPDLTLGQPDLPDIPLMPTISGVPSTFNINPPPFSVTILGNDYSLNPPAFSVSTSFISSPISSYNSLLTPVNTGITSVNNALETAHDDVAGALSSLSGLEIPLPQLQTPSDIGPITCPNPNPWDAVSFRFQSLDPNDYDIVNPLSSDNAFITFSDQYNNKLGAITAQGMGEFAQDYFDKEKVLEIGSYITGIFSDDGSVVKNLMKLGKEAIAFYKATDKMGVLYSSGHGDYAEWLERENTDENLGYGDIVGVRAGKISLSVENAEQVMVVSQAPIVLGNIPEAGKERNGNNVAFIGQVPVKVMGPVHTGDFIIANPSTPGFGIAVPEKEITPQQFVLAVGKSWETNTSPGFKFVNTIVGMHNNGWAGPIMQMQQRLDDQAATIQSLSTRLDKLEYGNELMADSKKPGR